MAAMLLCSVGARAAYEKINGVWINITSETNLTAEVVYDPDGYSGNVIIPETIVRSGKTYRVTAIASSAFDGDVDVTSVYIPESVTSIGGYAFSGCTSLTAINIPESVTSIGDYAFRNCSGMKSINFPRYCGAGVYAFQGCTGELTLSCELPLVQVGHPVKYYGYFYGSKFTSVVIEEGVTSVGPYAFWNCTTITSITIPESVTSIEGSAFYGCSSLTSITCKAVIPPTIGNSNTFYNVDKSIPLYVPAGSVDAYKAADYWKEFTNILSLPNAYTLTVSSAGYASLFLDYAAAIPEGVKVYIGSKVEDDRLMMTEVTGVLPANTGVIVRAPKGTYSFVESEDTPANVEGNLLSGTATDTRITAATGYVYYVLANKDSVVGMYRPKVTEGTFLNNANKAYLALKLEGLGIFDEEVNTDEEGVQLSIGLRFDFSGTTDIAPSTLNSHPSTLIYDLQGRRVENPTKGIYIINGKKVVWE